MTMELDAFCCRIGEGQGRTETAPGEFRFVLGEVEPGRFFELRAGDYAEIAQSTDLTSVTLIRARATLKVPSSIPAGLLWEVSILVDGIKTSAMTCGGRRSREITDLAVNASKHVGVHEVAVRLELVKQ
jgi:hypothetical protein